MKDMPIRYSTDVAASIRFYTALGLQVGPMSRPGVWAEMPAAAGMLAIHYAPAGEAGDCELAFQSEEPLEAVVARLREAGYQPEGIADENFGRSMRVKDPDGVWVQINEHDPELYT